MTARAKAEPPQEPPAAPDPGFDSGTIRFHTEAFAGSIAVYREGDPNPYVGRTLSDALLRMVALSSARIREEELGRAESERVRAARLEGRRVTV